MSSTSIDLRIGLLGASVTFEIGPFSSLSFEFVAPTDSVLCDCGLTASVKTFGPRRTASASVRPLGQAGAATKYVYRRFLLVSS